MLYRRSPPADHFPGAGLTFATVAQLVEHAIRNREVIGSIPIGGSKHLKPDSHRCPALGFYLISVFRATVRSNRPSVYGSNHLKNKRNLDKSLDMLHDSG
jgi:hypothetical protein